MRLEALGVGRVLTAVGVALTLTAALARAEPEPRGGRALYELSRTEPARFVTLLTWTDSTGGLMPAGMTDADAAALLGLGTAGVRDPVALLMHAVEAGVPGGSDRARMLDLLGAAARRGTSVIAILAERGVLGAYRERGLVAVSGDDYARRAGGRWCDHAGLTLVLEPGAIGIAGTRYPARFALVPASDDAAPDLLVAFAQPEPARLFLRYRPESDRLDRRFSWPGEWQRLHRCQGA